MDYVEYIGPYIRYMRNKKNISSGDLCQRCDITRLQLNLIESGKYEAHPNLLKKLLDQMGLSFIILFKSQEEYKALLEKGLRAFIYEDDTLQEELMQCINKINFEESILLPEYLFVKLFYVFHCNADNVIDESRRILDTLLYFVDSMSELYCFLYRILCGIYESLVEVYDKAIDFFTQAEKMPVNEYRELLYYYTADAYRYMNRYLQAIDYYDKAEALFTKEWNVNRLVRAKLQIGYCFNKLKDYDLAIYHLHEVLRIAFQCHNDEICERCYNLLALSAMMKEDYIGCIKYTEMVLKDREQDSILMFYRAFSYLKLKDYDSCLLWVEKRYAYPCSSLLYKYLNYVSILMDEKDPIAYLEDILEIEMQSRQSDHDGFILLSLIECYHEKQDYEAEMRCLRMLLHMGL